MNTNKLKIIFSLCFALCSIVVEAQDLYINHQEEQSVLSLSHVQKISFDSDNMQVQATNGNTTTYALGQLHYLSFKDYLTMEDFSQLTISQIEMYPNPCHQVLNIDFGTNPIPVHLNILNLEGKVLKSYSLKAMGIVSLDISNLPQGIYICHCNTANESKAIKIIKQ